MKKLLTVTACLLLGCMTPATAARPKKVNTKNAPIFSHFIYQGRDKVYEEHPLQSNEFYTPILQGCYPDPSICRKGKDYYLVNSTFAMFPGVPIFHSTDLVNWKQIGHVLDRPSQLSLATCRISGGIYAPAISYNPHNDTFYMITTQLSGGIGNMVVKTQDPTQGWSDPIRLAFDGIDPSLFFDEDGKAYIVHNDAPVQALYEGHRVIKLWEYDVEKDCVIPGTDRVIVDGGVDISRKPIWIEGPHLYKKNGYYYLMCAEGGTGDNHSEVIFRSNKVTGPYVPASNNPILTQRYFPQNRANRVDWTGHADLVEGPDGRYYGVFLGVRPNEAGLVNTGRETFMLPVDWSGDFPIFENGLIPLDYKLRMPGVENRTGKDGFFPNGNFIAEDNFRNETLDLCWVSIRGPREAFATINKNSGLKIAPFAADIREVKPVSILFRRQQHLCFTAQTTLQFTPSSDTELAGITCYQSEAFHYVFGLTRKEKDTVLILARTEKGESTIIASTPINPKQPVTLQVKGDGNTYAFAYSQGDAPMQELGGKVSGDILSTNVAGGFTGSLIGLYATQTNAIR